MSDGELCWMPAFELAAAIAKRKLSPVDVIDAVLARIERLKELNAYVTLDGERARRSARAAERALMRRGAELGPLHGVPFSAKDLLSTQGVRTTFGSPIFRDHVPAEDAPSVERLKAAGAILIGKTNTPTFGWVGVTDNLLFGATRNPWSLRHTPGGSSGGAGAAVAAGLAPLALGTDGGGSIRKPAAWCGIYGFKPSRGRIPVYPSSSERGLSHAGPMTRTVKDAALTMNACAGPDRRDRLSLPATELDFVKALRGSLKRLRVGWSETLGLAPAVDPEVRTAAAKAACVFQELGCRVEAVEPAWSSPYRYWRTLFLRGIKTRLAPHLERRDQIEPELYVLLEEASRITPAAYARAWRGWLAWWRRARTFFDRYDLLLTPTVAYPPLLLGKYRPSKIGGVPVGDEATNAFMYLFNMSGQPAASVPCGFTTAGLPVGLQIVGRNLDDAIVLRASAAFEAARPWAQRRPAIGC